MTETAGTQGSNWSVKPPNELNFVVANLPDQVSACQSNSRNSSTPNSPRDQTMPSIKQQSEQNKFSDTIQRLAAHKNPTQSRVQQRRNTYHVNEKVQRSAFFQMDRTIAAAKSKIPNPPLRMLNSHLPVKALNYLQMVDEPGVETVIQKFGGHSFQDQFKKPLLQHQTTLFQSSVRDRAQLPKQSDISISDLDGRQTNMMSRGWRLSRVEAKRRAESLHHPTSMLKQSINAVTTGGSRLRARHPMDTFQGSIIQQNTNQKLDQSIVFGRKGRSVSHVPANAVTYDSVQTGMQDSIESVIGMVPTLSGIGVEKTQAMAMQEMWYYNIDRGAYQPTFRENLAGRQQREGQLISLAAKSKEKGSMISQGQQTSVYHSRPATNQSLKDQVKSLNKNDRMALKSVIESSFRVRDIQDIKLRNNFQTQHPQTTKNAPTTALFQAQEPEQPQKKDAAVEVESDDVDRLPVELSSENRSLTVITGEIVSMQMKDADRCASLREESLASSVLVQDEANQSIKLSNSASAQDPSPLSSPLHSKIIVTNANSLAGQMRNRLKMSQMSAGASQNSQIEKKQKMVMPVVKEQKVFVSGSMAIRPHESSIVQQQSEGSRAIVLRSSTDCDRDSQGGVKVVREVGLSTKNTEEFSIRNQTAHKSSNQENQEVGLNINRLAVIDVPKAHLQESHEYVKTRNSAADYEEFRRAGIISQKISAVQVDVTSEDTAGLSQNLDAKGISTAQNTISDQHSKDIAHILPQESGEWWRQQRCWDPKNMIIQAIISPQPKNQQQQSQHSSEHNSVAFKRKIEQLIKTGENLSQPKNTALMKAYHEMCINEKEECAQYVITHYSLPKALTRIARTSNGHKRAFSQQSERLSRFNTNKVQPKPTNLDMQSSRPKDDPTSLEDIEQFTYQRDNKQMLTGPPGRKLSVPQASRLQQNLQKRRAASRNHDNFERSMPVSMKLCQPTTNSTIPTEVSFRELGSKRQEREHIEKQRGRLSPIQQQSAQKYDQKSMNCQGKTLDVVPRQKPSGSPDQLMQKSQKSKLARPVNKSLFTKAQHSHSNSPKNNKDLPSVAVRKSRQTSVIVNKDKNGNVTVLRKSPLNKRPQVPRLQLNKVDLELFSNDSPNRNQSKSPQFSNNGNAWPSQRNEDQIKAARMQYITAVMSPTLAAHVYNSNMSQQTSKMISIDVKTEAKKRVQKKEKDEALNQSKIKIIAQERSVQDTLYDTVNQEMLTSQKILSGYDYCNKVHNTDSFRNPKSVARQQAGVKVSYSRLDSEMGEPMSESRHKKIQLTTKPATILVSRENLTNKDGGLKLPTSETAIGLINVRDQSRMNERQRSQGLQVKTATGSQYNNEHLQTTCVRETKDYNYSEPPSALLSTANNMLNKYGDANLAQINDDRKMDSSNWNDNSLQTLPSRTQNNTMMQTNQDLDAKQQPNELLNIVVKAKPVGAATVNSIVQTHLSENNNDVTIVDKDEQTDLAVKESSAIQALADLKDYQQTDEPALQDEKIARLRYDSDRSAQQLKAISQQKKKIPAQQLATLQTIQTNSLGDEEKIELKEKLRHGGSGVNDSFNSSEYVSSLIIHPNDVEPEGRESRDKFTTHNESISVEKTTVYQLQAKFVNPIHHGSPLSRQCEPQVSHNRLSNCSQPSHAMKSQNSSIIESQDDSRINENATPLRKHQEVDPYWLDKYMKLQKKQYQRQYDRVLQKERQERILASKTAHLIKPQRRQHTPPISRNKLLEVPQKSHNQAKVCTFGNNHTVVEQIWAKNLSLSQFVNECDQFRKMN